MEIYTSQLDQCRLSCRTHISLAPNRTSFNIPICSLELSSITRTLMFETLSPCTPPAIYNSTICCAFLSLNQASRLKLQTKFSILNICFSSTCLSAATIEVLQTFARTKVRYYINLWPIRIFNVHYRHFRDLPRKPHLLQCDSFAIILISI